MKVRFDENDDLVIDDIPDDIMQMLEHLAARNDTSVEGEMRSVLCQWVGRVGST